MTDSFPSKTLVALGVSLLLAACAPLSPQLPLPLQLPNAERGNADVGTSNAQRELRVVTAPKPPQAAAQSEGPLVETPRLDDTAVAAVNLQQVPLANFIQLVYAEVLKKNVNLHPAVLQRQDPVTFRSGAGQTAGQVEQAVRLVLKSYGLSVLDVGGLVRVMPDNAAQGDLPAVRFGAAQPEGPLGLRPVFHLITLNAVRQTDVTNWLRTMFGDRVTVAEDAGRNAVLLRGNADNVRAAMEAIAMLDQPAMKGRASVALEPAYWSSPELALKLQEILSAEGYAVHPVGNAITPGASRFPVILLPVPALNNLYVFANSDAVAEHVVKWARQLDKPSESGIGKTYFTYAVRHKDADLLAQTLNRIVSPAAAAAATTGGQPGQPQQVTTGRTASVVVDKSTNTLIFQSRPDEYAQLLTLLQTLDRPSKSALIEVTVAELTLNDNLEIGVDLLASRIEAGGGYRVGTSNGGAASAALNIAVFNGLNVPKLAISALSSDSRATILSSPRLMTRNGEAATIQVGQEVPFISQQQSTGTATGATGLLQTVQYKNAGVILRIKPVIHSNDQIDLDVVQEVSEAVSTTTGVVSSPTFQLRKVDTKLTLRNGSTVLLGGLISNTGSQGIGGVPILKDIPLIGGLFGKQTQNGRRTELIILITPYIANDAHEAEAITDAFRKSLGPWAQQLPAGQKPAPTAPMPALAFPQ